jgi:hypothetical protein
MFPADQNRAEMWGREEREEAGHMHVEGEGDDDDCPLCKSGDDVGAAMSSGSVQAAIVAFEARNYGRVNDDVLLKSMLEERRAQIEKPLESQGIACARWSMRKLREHYVRDGGHLLNPRRLIGSDIQFCTTVQEHYRRQGILQRDTRTGQLSIDKHGLDTWLKMSKQRTWLCKEYASVTAAIGDGSGGAETLSSKKRKGADGSALLSTQVTKQGTLGMNYFMFSSTAN